MRKIVLFTMALLTIFLGGFFQYATASQKITQAYDFDQYRSFSFSGFTKTSEFATMTDGTRLALDIFLPADYIGSGTEPESFPTILIYTPYNRATIDLDSGEITDMSTDELFQTVLAYGYAFVIADMRGSGASYGGVFDFTPQFCEDGKDLVDWIAAQSWSDGGVGMIGGSYYGWSQLCTASQAPEALKCIVPWVVFMEGYSETLRPGGIPLYTFRKIWSGSLWAKRRNMNLAGLSAPSAPVVDEDGDGSLVDEIPLDLDQSGTFYDDYDPDNGPWPPQYPDTDQGVVRTEHYYYYATADHFQNDVDIEEWADDLEFIDQDIPMEGVTVRDVSSRFAPKIIDSQIPVYNIGGWFDGFVRGTTELYSTMKPSIVTKMMIKPTYHESASQGFIDYLGINETWNDLVLGLELVKWFEHWLGGVENGVENEPPVLIYVMNGVGWRTENEWPLERQVLTDYYFESGGGLSTEQAADRTASYDEYTADFTHNSGYGEVDASWLPLVGKETVTQTFYKNRYMALAGSSNTPSELPIRTELDEKCLTYTTDSLEEDTEVTGHPMLTMYATSTADYGDFYFYLEDVDASGRAILVTETLLRAEFANLVDNDEIIGSEYGVDVLPDLPWYGFRSFDYVDRVFAAASGPVKLVVDFQPTSWVFKAGHKIRVSIACADWPTFMLHPKLAPNNQPDDAENIIPTITVYRDSDRPSKLELPIIPASETTTVSDGGKRSSACFLDSLQ